MSCRDVRYLAAFRTRSRNHPRAQRTWPNKANDDLYFRSDAASDIDNCPRHGLACRNSSAGSARGSTRGVTWWPTSRNSTLSRRQGCREEGPGGTENRIRQARVDQEAGPAWNQYNSSGLQASRIRLQIASLSRSRWLRATLASCPAYAA